MVLFKVRVKLGLGHFHCNIPNFVAKLKINF